MSRSNDEIIKALEEFDGSGLEVRQGKYGRGIHTLRAYRKNEFVVEYIGKIISFKEAKTREQQYGDSDNCYMYFFRYNEKTLCIDATYESGSLGRLINHSNKGNLSPKLIQIHGTSRIIFLAKQNIAENTELLYDYGDKRAAVVKTHPWLVGKDVSEPKRNVPNKNDQEANLNVPDPNTNDQEENLNVPDPNANGQETKDL